MKPKILFILHFPPPTHGSAVIGKQIAESELINRSFSCDYVNLSTSRSIDEIGKKGIIKYIRTLAIYFNVLWKLCTRRYDLCYLAITVTRGGLLKDTPLVILCKLFKKKIVIHQHNKGVSLFQDKLLYNNVYKLLYKKVKVMLLSWHLYPDISKYVAKNDVCICPNGILPSDIPKQSLSHTNNIPRLLFLSNLIESKGCLILLDACRILKEKGVSFYCDFVGGESKEISSDTFNQEIQIRGLSDCVLYQGPKYGPNKSMFFTNADIFVFPTFYYNETFGLVNLEAMQYKLPVISTFEGGIPDVVDDGITGFLTKQKDVADLANKIEILIREPQLRIQMGEAGYAKFADKFTLSKFEETLNDILHDITK